MKKFVVKIILFTCILDILIVTFAQDQNQICKDKCIRLSEDLEDSNWTCDSSCRVEQCDNGCSLWEKAVTSTCRDTCSESHASTNEVQYCIAGCNLAVDIYAQEVKDALAHLSSPELVRNQNESVILKWEEDTSLTFNVSRHLQKIVPGLVSEWQDHDNIEWLYNHQVNVTGLRPYTSYKFRLIIEIVNGRHSVLSPPSFEITTRPYGAPVEAPKIANLATASTSLHIKLKPPFYINAPVVGYEINVTKEDPPGIPAPYMTLSSRRNRFEYDGMTKSVGITNTDLNHETTAVITRLRPSTQYKVQVKLRNENGLGPAVTRYIKTKEANTEWNEAKLICGADNKVLRQSPLDMNPFQEVLFETDSSSNNVTGVAFHYDQNKIFISVTSGSIFTLDLGTVSTGEGSGDVVTISTVGATSRKGRVAEIYHSNNNPKALNVDWLNDKLYIAEQDKIMQCSLLGTECITAISDLIPRPNDVKVDPGSGYLFWVQAGKGIYRRELSSLADETTSTSHFGDRIINADMVYAIAIDHTNYRIFYANNSKSNGNTILSANFDGSDIMDMRTNAVSPHFLVVESITHVNRLFVWTVDAGSIYYEEKELLTDKIHHNQIFLEEHHFTGLNIWHPGAQPTPVPFVSPRNLQAVFSENSAKLTWDPPGNGQDEGGYNTWQYEIEEINLRSGFNYTFSSPHASLYNNVQNMLSETNYSFRVRAFSSAGKGPWCDAFVGSTLKTDSSQGKLVVVDSENARYSFELNGDHLKILESYMGYEKLQEFEVYQNTVLWSSDEGNMFRDNGPVGDLRYVRTFAYDWIGNTLYWAPTRSAGTIRRLSLNSYVDNLSESVVQEAMGNPIQNLIVDALEGYLYWTTQYSVESARLNGKNYTTIFKLPNAYSGMYVMGMAINHEDGYLYWLLKTGDTTSLYEAELFRDSTDGIHIYSTTIQVPVTHRLFDFQTDALPIKMQYYSHKLYWIVNKSRDLEILDVHSKSLARISLETSGDFLQAFVIDHISKYRFPGGLNRTLIKVIPESIPSKSIKQGGSWDNFHITWAPAKVNYGQLYYVILLRSESESREILSETIEPHLSHIAGFAPYTLLTVTLEVCTLWGCSDPVEHHLYTPMSAPTLPGRTRTYVTHYEKISSSSKEIEVEFHWDEPDPQNGIIKSYVVQVAQDERGPWNRSEEVPGQKNYYVVTNAKNNSFYYFKVKACTEIACSDYSEVTSANTTVQKPVPKLLTTSENSIKMFLPDEKEESKRSQTLENDQVCAVTYIAREDTYFWLNKRGTIIRKDSQGNTTKIVSTRHSGNSLTVDWVGRDLYWAEQKSEDHNAIVKYDLNKHGSEPTIVMSMVTVVWKLDISPYRSSLYWTESTDDGDHSQLMSSDLNGNNKRAFFSNTENRIRRQGCTCTGVPISKVFVIDQSGGKDAELYFVQDGTKTIWASDLNGCICRVILNGSNTAGHSLGLPPDSMTIDQEHLYWSNTDLSTLYSINKWTGEGLQAVLQDTGNLGNLKNILAYGDHLQPMPDSKCLLIESYTKTPILRDSTDTSLELVIEPWTPSTECFGISVPTVKYIVHYKELYSDGDDSITCDMKGVPCLTKESYDLEVELTGLKPFTNYMVQVSVTNYYMENRQRRPVFAPNIVFFTKTGVPSPPRNIIVIPITPTQVNISWTSPIQPNANYEDIQYILHWHTGNTEDKTTSQVRKEIQGIPYRGQCEGICYSYKLKNLTSATMYYIKLLATTRDTNQYNASEEFWVKTYQEPTSVIRVNYTYDSITVKWKSSTDKSMVRHKIELAKAQDEDTELEWISQEYRVHTSMNSTVYFQTFNDLEPNTNYAFRVKVIYRSNEEYTWPIEIKKKNKIQTNATLPGQPTAPEIEHQQGRGVKELVWREPYSGGLKILKYQLYARAFDDLNWTSVYNGTDKHWIMSGFNMGKKYMFAVKAKNALGWSELSENSSQYVYSVPVSKNSEKMTLVLSVSFAVVFLIVIMVLLLLLLLWKRYRDPKAKQFCLVNGFRHRTDMELATLREMPRVAMQTNALYALNIVPTDEGIAALPHYHREDLSLTKFLGSGAFGEVYEGIATNILSSDSGETKVAVKALKKGATDNEKEEFLKEALLMSNFKHDHILRLLGVCLHNDPQFLILELMDGGDLLTYLRASRSTPSVSATLELSDMVSMCVDVAKGCKYLEELHFVHRDLAARNCLVSERNNGDRIVKIGDFGLARDIYKSDYYRKEGEGLMPVRWMSPESLVDGVFTTHSDVWAFGVLMWEVLTLGQQPYPARTNLDVLNYVRRGGRLDRPDNCADDMYDLMLKCWYYNPDARPSFRSMLCQLETFKRKSEDPSSDFYRRRQNPNSLTVRLPTHTPDGKLAMLNGHHGETDSAKAKNLKSNNVKRSFSFDMKGRFGIHPNTSRNSHEGSGYLEPLVPVGEENKYLELLGGNEPPSKSCVKCGRIGCDERCHRGIIRHSSDCTHSLRNKNKRLHKNKDEGKGSKKGTGKGKSSKSKSKCDKVFNDSGSSTSGTGSGMESLPEDSADDTSSKVKTVKGTKYRNVANSDNPWLMCNVFGDDNDYPNSATGNNVPGFLIHPPMLVKRSSFTPSEMDSTLSLSIPLDFDELSPNNRSSVDSNSPLLTWGSSKDNPEKDNAGVYQNGFLVTPSGSNKKHKDLDYLRRSAVYNLETSGESLV